MIDLTANAKLFVGPDFEADGESLGKTRDVLFFATVAEALERYKTLGPRKYGAFIETKDGTYHQDAIEATIKGAIRE